MKNLKSIVTLMTAVVGMSFAATVCHAQMCGDYAAAPQTHAAPMIHPAVAITETKSAYQTVPAKTIARIRTMPSKVKTVFKTKTVVERVPERTQTTIVKEVPASGPSAQEIAQLTAKYLAPQLQRVDDNEHSRYATLQSGMQTGFHDLDAADQARSEQIVQSVNSHTDSAASAVIQSQARIQIAQAENAQSGKNSGVIAFAVLLVGIIAILGLMIKKK